MSLEERIEKLEQQANNISEQETDIPKFQNPDRCVFCTDKNYDSIWNDYLRLVYNYKTEKDYQKQDKETCMHHNDGWLKYSYNTGGFIWSAITDHGKKSMTGGEILELFKNKEERERLLTKYYDETKHVSWFLDLYESRKKRTGNGQEAWDYAEENATRNDKIIHDKLKIYYTNAVEALRTLDDEETQ